MDAQAIDVLERGRAGTVVKHSLENRDRFTAQAAPVRRGTCLELPVKFLRKFLDQQSRHGSVMISNQYRRLRVGGRDIDRALFVLSYWKTSERAEAAYTLAAT
jgi:hypothetical protein